MTTFQTASALLQRTHAHAVISGDTAALVDVLAFGGLVGGLPVVPLEVIVPAVPAGRAAYLPGDLDAEMTQHRLVRALEMIVTHLGAAPSASRCTVPGTGTCYALSRDDVDAFDDATLLTDAPLDSTPVDDDFRYSGLLLCGDGGTVTMLVVVCVDGVTTVVRARTGPTLPDPAARPVLDPRVAALVSRIADRCAAAFETAPGATEAS